MKKIILCIALVSLSTCALAAQCKYIGTTWTCFQNFDNTTINWADINRVANINSGGLNWPNINGLRTINDGSVNWADVNAHAGINSGGVNWADVNRRSPVNNGGLNWVDMKKLDESFGAHSGINWQSFGY